MIEIKFNSSSKVNDDEVILRNVFMVGLGVLSRDKRMP